MINGKLVPIAEIVCVFLVASLIIVIGWQLVGEGVLARQAVVWVANVAMLLTIWWGLHLRGQTWAHFGLGVNLRGWRQLLGGVLKSVLVLVLALTAFIMGGAFAPNVVAGSQQADMSSYDWLRGNLPMLLLALMAVYIASSFGEEVVYRGFLISRLLELGNGGALASTMAVTASAIVFGLVHFSWGIVGIIQTTFMGAALGISYLALKRQLWVLVLAHCYLDTLLLIQIYLSPIPDAAP